MKEGRKPEYPEKTPGDELQIYHCRSLFNIADISLSLVRYRRQFTRDRQKSREKNDEEKKEKKRKRGTNKKERDGKNPEDNDENNHKETQFSDIIPNVKVIVFNRREHCHILFTRTNLSAAVTGLRFKKDALSENFCDWVFSVWLFIINVQLQLI